MGVNDGVLQIVGTDVKDRVHVKLHHKDQVKVEVGFLKPKSRIFDLADISSIHVVVGGGDDHVHIDKKILLDAVIDGGGGKDYLHAGGGDAIMFGGPGNDHLHGGDGADILIGGSGRDKLCGGKGNDILAGVTPMKSLGMARYMKNKVPGMDVPDWVIKRLKGVEKKKQATEGIAICCEQIAEFKEMQGVAGVHIMAIEWEQKMPQIVEQAKLLPRPKV